MNKSAGRQGNHAVRMISVKDLRTTSGHQAGTRLAWPRSSMLKWVAIGGLAAGIVALFMRPKKAY